MTDFVNLNVKTHYSILSALSSPKEVLTRAKELGQKSLAITEYGSLASGWDAYKISRDLGIKFIPGCDFYFANDNQQQNDKLRHLILLAKNAEGYKNLLMLHRKGFDANLTILKKVVPVIDWKLLEQYKEGLLCLTGCGNGIIGQSINNKDLEGAETILKRLLCLFGDNLGAEIQAHNISSNATTYRAAVNQIFTNSQVIRLAKKYNIKIIPTSFSHYTFKGEHEINDVLQAIGSMQPVYSNNRLKFNTQDLYLKSGDEIKAFFARNYGEDFATEICKNTVEFAERCENSDWVDPKFSNPSGKELPVFPVKDEPDYEEYLKWLETQSEEIKNLSASSSYLRFKCFTSFEKKLKHKIISEKIPEYIKRIENELNVLDHQGFSDYMLVVSDYVRWARENGVMVGPGRGCVGENTLVLTENGYKKISEIKIGEKVFTHTGSLQQVLNTFKYDVSNEELINLKTDMSFGDTVLTKDHKLLRGGRGFWKYPTDKKVRERNWDDCFNNKNWVSVDNYDKFDVLWMEFPKLKNDNCPEQVLDLSKFVKIGKIYDNYIEYEKSIEHKLSFSNISKITEIPKYILENVKYGRNNLNIKYKDILYDFLNQHNISFEEWLKLELKQKIKISRYLKLDKEFYRILGIWIGDGFTIEDNRHRKLGIGYSLNADEIDIQDRIIDYFRNLGFNPIKMKKKKENAVQIEINNELLLGLIKYLIPEYKKNSATNRIHSNTKHLPYNFRNISFENKRALLDGLFDADGGQEQKHPNQLSITTISYRLILELKELLLYLGIPSAVVRWANSKNKDGAIRQQAYTIEFNTNYSSNEKQNRKFKTGYFCRIKKINRTRLQYVYDICVENDHSYITTNFVSHNSVGGSLVAHLLNIHQADSIRYNLVFERFQNSLKKSMPDIDLDFAPSGREKVIEYITNKYGSNNTGFISNLNRLKPKMFVKDLARSLQLGGSSAEAVKIGNSIAETIPSVPEYKDTIKFEKLLNLAIFNEYCKKYPQYSKYNKILGTFRNLSTHAGAQVISKRPLIGLVPVRLDKDGRQSIEYDKDDTEENGLLKMDILGLSTLDDINQTIALVNKNNKFLKLENIDFEAYDEKTYDLISSGETFCVFQLGTSTGTIDLCRKIKPKSIDDLAIITTLARPAAANIRNEFILTRAGKKDFKLLHPSLKSAFENSYGYGLYDESILQLGSDVAGWKLDEADRLRKMIKEKGKYPEKEAKLREDFIAGAIKNKIEEKMAIRIWDEEVSKFKGYTFNRSHAVLYSFISFITAYLKAHCPLEYLLTCLKSELESNAPNSEENADKIKNELRKLGNKILPPNINHSQMSYDIQGENILRTGFEAIKQVGDDAIEEIIAKRPFISFDDFMLRTESKKMRANALQALVAVGALDDFKLPRKLMFLYASDYRKKLQVWLKKHDPRTEKFSYQWPEIKEWSIPELYALEYKYMGEAFIADKRQAYGNFFSDTSNKAIPFKAIKKMPDRDFLHSVKGEIKSIHEMKVKKETSRYLGQDMLKCTIEDEFGDQISLTLFPETYKRAQSRMKTLFGNKHKIDVGLALHFNGSVNIYGDETGIIMNEFFNAAPPPQLPKDLKAKKISVKRLSKNSSSDKKQEDVNKIIENLEDELFNQGFIDLDQEDDESGDIEDIL